MAYAIITSPAVSGDAGFNGSNPPDVSLTNTNDDNPPELDRVWGGCGLTGLEGFALVWVLFLAGRLTKNNRGGA
jgi:hypothetical protein